MAKKNSNYVVPKELQHSYKMAVQRANRRIKANLKYIRENDITNEFTIRSLVGSFDKGVEVGNRTTKTKSGKVKHNDIYFNGTSWSSKTMPFSRSNEGRYILNADTGQMEFKKFKNKTEFEQYMRYLNKWGQQTKKGEYFDTHPEQIKENYKSAIIRALNEVKDHYSITLPNGQIPKAIIDDINSMTLSQITNFFGNGDPAEDVEISQFNSDDFIAVETAEDFTDVVRARIASVKKFVK